MYLNMYTNKFCSIQTSYIFVTTECGVFPLIQVLPYKCFPPVSGFNAALTLPAYGFLRHRPRCSPAGHCPLSPVRAPASRCFCSTANGAHAASPAAARVTPGRVGGGKRGLRPCRPAGAALPGPTRGSVPGRPGSGTGPAAPPAPSLPIHPRPRAARRSPRLGARGAARRRRRPGPPRAAFTSLLDPPPSCLVSSPPSAAAARRSPRGGTARGRPREERGLRSPPPAPTGIGACRLSSELPLLRLRLPACRRGRAAAAQPGRGLRSSGKGRELGCAPELAADVAPCSWGGAGGVGNPPQDNMTRGRTATKENEIHMY